MRVFISWSGEHSRRVAEALREWLPSVIQAVKPWVSAEDIDKGQQWFAEVQNSLADSKGMGIFCLTPENLTAPWISFEAGVIAAHDKSMVATFLHGIGPDALKPPLSLFQATRGEKADVLKLLRTLNSRLPDPLGENLLTRSFDTNWPSLQSVLGEIDSGREKITEPKRSTDEVLAEVLATLRRLEAAQVDAAEFEKSKWQADTFTTSSPLNPSKTWNGMFAPDEITKNQLLAHLLREPGRRFVSVPAAPALSVPPPPPTVPPPRTPSHTPIPPAPRPPPMPAKPPASRRQHGGGNSS